MGFYTFLVGPDRSLTNGVDQRFKVAVKEEYIEMDKAPAGILLVNQSTFAFRYPDLAPISKNALDRHDVIVETIAWERVGSVRRRIDGTWPNHYLIYDHPAGDAHGMRVRIRSDMPSEESRLLINDQSETIIECQKVVGLPAPHCRMLHKVGPNLTIDARFDVALLPKWKNIIQLCKRLVKPIAIVSRADSTDLASFGQRLAAAVASARAALNTGTSSSDLADNLANANVAAVWAAKEGAMMDALKLRTAEYQVTLTIV
ncbi:MAG: hypothetical protein P0Y59_04645 [Candidatus Sphingomonas phytovorans]|nr:hypothetical protein [Sphingomonas sp.]WEK00990.1 MAG: hypothetical protein P0Y59_04645 [Sphingomonas sp.]